MTHSYIGEEIADHIKQVAKLIDVAHVEVLNLKKKGKDWIGVCPSCANKKFSIDEKKEIYKCFSGCEIGGVGAIDFIMKVKKLDYPSTLVYLANHYNVMVEAPKSKVAKEHSKLAFRDQQLLASGIPLAQQKWYEKTNKDTRVEKDRYSIGTIDKHWNVVPGDDMILHYLNLEGEPITIKMDGKQMPLLRVRYQNPQSFVDRNGKAAKYRSPKDSGSHLWLPSWMIQSYNTFVTFDTLFICEGEKKADKMCLSGLPACGVMGIHNWDTVGEMPGILQRIIKRCEVKQVVFLMDSDWQEISVNSTKSIDARPRSFFKATLKFRDYFAGYENVGIYLNTYLAYGNDLAYKGIDDVLVRHLKGEEKQLVDDFQFAMKDINGLGKYVTCKKLNNTSDYKISEWWGLQNVVTFVEKHKTVLKSLDRFMFNGYKWTINEAGEAELAQAIMPQEQYWYVKKTEDRQGNVVEQVEFRYTNMLNFLMNRGYYLYKVGDAFTFVHVEGKIVRETNAQEIRRYVLDFTKEIGEYKVLEMLHRGGKQYVGADKLNDLNYFYPEWLQSSKDVHYMCFNNVYWEITAEGIKEKPIHELPAHQWSDKVIDFDPKRLEKPMFWADREGNEWRITTSLEYDKCDIAQYYLKTSAFAWKKHQELQTLEDGREVWVERPPEKKEKWTMEDLDMMYTNIVCKMLAAGYCIHDYLDYSMMKAVVVYDGVESEVGRSQGGTGKSIWAKQFEHLTPIEVVDGKKKNLEDDNHIYENVTERTSIIVFDDVRVNFNFEWLFSQITTQITVNPKGIKRYNLTPRKNIVVTNHMLNGNGNSFDRRQYPVAFSDYYNKHRTVGDDFGYQLFREWDHEQWNLYYNWQANCVQLYLKNRLSYTIPQEDLEKRKLRQFIGESFLDWASSVYDTEIDPETKRPMGPFLNQEVLKTFMYDHFIQRYKSEQRYTDERRFKEKLQAFAKYMDYEWNPQRQGGRIKSSANEYFTVADKNFVSAFARKLHNELDVTTMQTQAPF